MDQVINLLGTISEELGLLVLGIILLVIARLARDFLTPYRLTEELTGKDNPALGLSMTGYYFGVIAIYIGTIIDTNGHEGAALHRLEHDFSSMILESLLYTLAGIALLNTGRFIVDKLVLYRFDTRKEIIEDRNSGTGAVEFGNYLATGLIIGGAVSGFGGGIETMLAFFIAGQVILVLYCLVYQRVISYDIHDEIEKDNVAAGLALGGNMAACGIILMKGTAGDFISWPENFSFFFTCAVIGIPVLLAFRSIIDIFLFPGVSLKDEITKDRNLNAGYLESGLLVGLAAIFYFI